MKAQPQEGGRAGGRFSRVAEGPKTEIALPAREAHADAVDAGRHHGFGPAPKGGGVRSVFGWGFTLLWPVSHALGGRGERARRPAAVGARRNPGRVLAPTVAAWAARRRGDPLMGLRPRERIARSPRAPSFG
ncbi:hypothetical protein GCM10022205_39000 [Spinactinospora alkalitolerans]